MDEKGYRDAAAVVHEVAVHARHESRQLDEHRAALARNALVWWQGGAAERYQQLVQDRVNALAQVGGHLDELAQRADRLAEDLEAEAAIAAAVARIHAEHPVIFR